MDALLKKGYADRVTLDMTPSVCEWYLPHHKVVNSRTPEKFRIVFDCATQYSGTSLNSETLQGPDMTNQLIGVLTRFREKPVAVMVDIEGMFHQVTVTPEHRDALRFLCWKDGNLEQEPEIQDDRTFTRWCMEPELC